MPRRREARIWAREYAITSAAGEKITSGEDTFIIGNDILKAISVRANAGSGTTVGNCSIQLVVPGITATSFVLHLKDGVVRQTGDTEIRGDLNWQGNLSFVGLPGIESRRPYIRVVFQNDTGAVASIFITILHEVLI